MPKNQIFTTKNPVTGVVSVTSEPGVGKTTFALSSGAHPGRIAFFDDDVKGRIVVQQLAAQGIKFGHYHDLVDLLKGKKELDQFDTILSLLDQIKPGELDCIVFDTWSRVESLFHPVVIKNPKTRAGRSQYRDFWPMDGRFAGAQEHQVAEELESQFISRLLDLAPLVILTSHLKDEYVNNKRSGKQAPIIKKAAIKKSALRLWLRLNPDGPEPIGLVMKPIDQKRVTENGIETLAVLPRRIVPATWKRILEYWTNPIGNRPLTKDEKPDDFEMSLITGALTADQIKVLSSGGSEAEEGGLPVDFPVMVNQVQVDGELAQTMLDQGRTLVEVASYLSEQMSETVNVPDVLRATTEYKSKLATNGAN